MISDRSRRKPGYRHQYYEGPSNGTLSATEAASTGAFAGAVGDHAPCPVRRAGQRNNADGLMFAESDYPRLHVALQIPVLMNAGLDDDQEPQVRQHRPTTETGVAMIVRWPPPRQVGPPRVAAFFSVHI